MDGKRLVEILYGAVCYRRQMSPRIRMRKAGLLVIRASDSSANAGNRGDVRSTGPVGQIVRYTPTSNRKSFGWAVMRRLARLVKTGP